MKTKNLYRIVSAMLIMAICTCDLSQYVSANPKSAQVATTETTDNVSKEDTNENKDQEPTEEVSKEETVVEKTLDTTTFEGDDGKKELVVHGYNVRYEDEKGELVDYDPSLVQIDEEKSQAGENLRGYKFENKDGDSKNYIPEQLSEDTPIRLEKDDYKINFRPIFTNEEVPIQLEDTTSTIIQEQAVEEAKEIAFNETDGESEKEVATIIADSIEETELEKVEVSSETIENIYEEEVEVDNTATYSVVDKSIE